jgi:hypothetical protein
MKPIDMIESLKKDPYAYMVNHALKIYVKKTDRSTYIFDEIYKVLCEIYKKNKNVELRVRCDNDDIEIILRKKLLSCNLENLKYFKNILND